MRALVATVTNSQQKGGDEPCETQNALKGKTDSEATAPIPIAPSTDELTVSSNAAPTSDPEGAATKIDLSAEVEIETLKNQVIELERALQIRDSRATPLPSVTETAWRCYNLSNSQLLPDEAVQQVESILSRFLGAREHELRELRAECERLRKDKERLEWVMEFITQNGGDGIAKLIWSQVDPEEIMEDRIDLTFDRAAIDAAMQPSETRERL